MFRKLSDEIFSYVIDLMTSEMLTRGFENNRIQCQRNFQPFQIDIWTEILDDFQN